MRRQLLAAKDAKITNKSAKKKTEQIKIIMAIMVAVTLVLAGINAEAQVTSSQAYYGARNVGLAGSDVAHQTDAWAIFNNPAALAGTRQLTGAFSYENTLGQSFLPHAMGSFLLPTSSWGTFGLAVDNMAVNYGGRDLTSEMSVGLYQGFHLLKDVNTSLAVGYGVKYLQVDYGKSAGAFGDGSDGIDLGTSRGAGLDIGFIASLQERHYLGARVMNVNSPQIGSGNALIDLPVKLQIGVAYSPYHYVWTTFALTRQAGTATQYHAGIEYKVIDAITLFTGIHSNPNRFGAGLRVRFKSFMVDYGMITHPVFPLTHQFSFGFAL